MPLFGRHLELVREARPSGTIDLADGAAALSGDNGRNEMQITKRQWIIASCCALAFLAITGWWWRKSESRAVATLRGHNDVVRAIAMSHNCSYLASAGRDCRILLWDPRTYKLLTSLEGHSAQVTALAFTGDGQFLVSTSEDGTVRLWDVNRGREITRIADSAQGLNCLAVSATGIVAFSGKGGIVYLWDVEKRTALKSLPSHKRPINALAFSLDGRVLIAASSDGLMRIWDALRRTAIGEISAGRHRIHHIAISLDGKLVACAAAGMGVGIWQVADRQRQEGLPNAGQARAVAFVSESVLATVHEDGALKYWDIAAGRLLHREMAHSGPALTVAVCPEEKSIATAGADHVLRIWSARLSE